MQNSITTAELFRLLSLSIGREKEATRYMVAKVMGVSPGTANLWQKGISVMDEANAEKAAELLGLDLEFVILSLQAERMSKSNLDKIAAIFERAALATQTRAASVFLGLFAVSALLPSLASALPGLNACILC